MGASVAAVGGPNHREEREGSPPTRSRLPARIVNLASQLLWNGRIDLAKSGRPAEPPIISVRCRICNGALQHVNGSGRMVPPIGFREFVLYDLYMSIR